MCCETTRQAGRRAEWRADKDVDAVEVKLLVSWGSLSHMIRPVRGPVEPHVNSPDYAACASNIN